MSEPYTTRFLLTKVAAQRYVFTVPQNMRAVVMTVAFNNQASSSAKAAYTHHGHQLVFPLIPASDSVVYTDLRLPLYEGETCELYLTQAAMSGVVSGYLFADNGPGTPPPFTTPPALEFARPLPADGAGDGASA